MFISDIYSGGRKSFSLEVFPPKKDSSFESILNILEEVTSVGPDFVSVTYGASGNLSNVKYSQTVANVIRGQYDTEALAHLTCIGTTEARMGEVLDRLEKINIQNILALRGDLPPGYSHEGSELRYATDLIALIKRRGGFCVGAACYPEGHVEERHPDERYEIMLKKQHAGADFFISQLFFDNRYFLDFWQTAVRRGVSRPIIAGVMPILGKSQIKRMTDMCGASLPDAVTGMFERYKNPADLRLAGIEYALRQAEELVREGVDGLHIYTMNQPDIAHFAAERVGAVCRS